MEDFEKLTGRRMKIMDWYGDPEAEDAIVLMATGA